MTISGTSTRGLNRVLGTVFGGVYILVGLLGFAVSGGHGFAATDGGKLLGIFMVNPLHNVVHLLIGVVGLALSRTLAGAKTFGLLLLVGYGLAFVYGVIAVGKDWDFLNINWADNVLHILSAVVGGLIYAGANRFAGARAVA